MMASRVPQGFTTHTNQLFHGGQAAPYRNPSGKDETPWRPYENAWTETSIPLFRSLPNAYFRFRWMALWPFHFQVGRCPGLGYVSAGEVLMVAALVGAAIGWAWVTWSSHAAGHAAVAFLTIAYALAGRNNIFTFLLGLSHERAIRWHALMAVLATLLSLYHGILEHVAPHRIKFMEEPKGFIIGWIGTGFMVALVLISATRHIRHRFFNTWKWIHYILVGLTYIFLAVLHFHFMHIGGGLWVLDLLIRRLYMAVLKNPKEVEIVALPADVTRISWPAGKFQYAGGQYVFICIPAIGWAEYHPFSLSSSPGSDQVHLHVRALGDWTRSLRAFALKDAAPGQPKTTRAYIEGPFGSPSINLYGDRYKCFTMICGGIGVTPLQSFFNDLMSQRCRGRPVRLSHLVWSVRDKAMVDNVKGYDKVYAATQLPAALPTAFQPDLLSPNIYALQDSSMPSAPRMSYSPRAGSPRGVARRRPSSRIMPLPALVSQKGAPGGTVGRPSLQLTPPSPSSSSSTYSSSSSSSSSDSPDGAAADAHAHGKETTPAEAAVASGSAASTLAAAQLEGDAANATGAAATTPATPPHTPAARSDKLPALRTQPGGPAGPVAESNEYDVEEAVHAVPAALVKDFIATEFYLTQVRDASQFDRANIHPGLQKALRFGRPDIPAILADDAARAEALGQTRLAVMVCGPPELVAIVKGAAAAAEDMNGGVVKLDVHSEVFEF